MQPDQAEIEISVTANYIGASPGAGSHGDQSAIATALQKRLVNYVARGEEQIALGPGFEQHARSKAVRRQLAVRKPCAARGADYRDERLQLLGNVCRRQTFAGRQYRKRAP